MTKDNQVNAALFLGFILLIIAIKFRKEIARSHIKNQNNFWGFKFGERTLKGTEKMTVLIPFLWIIFMLLVKFGIIK